MLSTTHVKGAQEGEKGERKGGRERERKGGRKREATQNQQERAGRLGGD